MMTAMCPRCRELRNMQSTVTKWMSKERDGRRRMRTESHHCEKCGVFVSSEDSEETALDDRGTLIDDNQKNQDDPNRDTPDGSPTVPTPTGPSPQEGATKEH